MTTNEIVALAETAGLRQVVDLDGALVEDIQGACRTVRAWIRGGSEQPWDLAAIAAVESAIAEYEAQE